MLPLIPADVLRALGLVLVPLAAVRAALRPPRAGEGLP